VRVQHAEKCCFSALCESPQCCQNDTGNIILKQRIIPPQQPHNPNSPKLKARASFLQIRLPGHTPFRSIQRTQSSSPDHLQKGLTPPCHLQFEVKLRGYRAGRALGFALGWWCAAHSRGAAQKLQESLRLPLGFGGREKQMGRGVLNQANSQEQALANSKELPRCRTHCTSTANHCTLMGLYNDLRQCWYNTLHSNDSVQQDLVDRV